MNKKETCHVWKTPHGGTLTLTQDELIEEYRGKSVIWTHDEFLEKTDDPASLACRMIRSVFGKKLVNRIRRQIRRYK